MTKSFLKYRNRISILASLFILVWTALVIRFFHIQVLNGESGPKSDIIVLNAAAGLVVAGIAENLVDGIERARSSIDSGAAKSKLQELQTFTQELIPK